ncbi:hypothetical protein ACFHW4_28930, partial [Mycolicibacterium senegalense]
GAVGAVGGVDRITISRLRGAVGTGAKLGARPILPLVDPPPPPPPPPPDTTADGACAVAPDTSAEGACPVVPVTPADCRASSVDAARFVEAAPSVDVDVDVDVWLEPTFAVGPLDAEESLAPTLAFGPADAFGPPRLPFDFLDPPVRSLPTLARWSDFFFLSLWWPKM